MVRQQSKERDIMPSFDVKCGFDMQEMDNAVNMVKRDILNRYDFKGSDSSITLNRNDNNIVIKGDIDYQVNAVFDMNKVGTIDPIVTKEVLDANPNWAAEWEG